ncbi:MAG: M23 family metallopeptidase [Firmicutes bacterium]|nr:M23 family metallopeptidase [Bacillota bacterium]
MKKFWMILTALVLCWGGFCRPAPAAEPLSLYITTAGDTVAALGSLSGTEAGLLAAMNNVPADAVLPGGMLLRLPEQPLFRVQVGEGDTFWSIAQRYGVPLEQLYSLNGLTARSAAYPGQTLRIPLAEEVSAVAGSPLAAEEETAWVAAALASRLGETSFAWPLSGVITSPFGKRSRGWHSGLDIAAGRGTPIAAAAAGQVIEAGWKNDAYGYAVMLRHDRRLVTLYAHCDELWVQEGQWVAQGQTLGLVGLTGHTTGPHVHFEVRLNGECVNPLEYLPQQL